MNREEYIKNLIVNKGQNIKSFAKMINMPYSTLRSILENGIGGAAIDNIIKICAGLNISIETLEPKNFESSDIMLSKHEKNLIIAYRNKPEMQHAIDKLLGIGE